MNTKSAPRIDVQAIARIIYQERHPRSQWSDLPFKKASQWVRIARTLVTRMDALGVLKDPNDQIQSETAPPYGHNTGEMSGDEIISRALEVLRDRLAANPKGQQLGSPSTTRKLLKLELAQEKNEVFCGIFLDTRHRLINFDRMFNGTIDAAHVHPRVVVERALQHGAAAVIVAHNHPSGIAEPSQADLAITRRLRDALGLVDIRLLDHFIVGHDSGPDLGVISLAERGLV